LRRLYLPQPPAFCCARVNEIPMPRFTTYGGKVFGTVPPG